MNPAYWRTSHWQTLRVEAITRAASLCHDCGRTKGIGVHHLSYAHIGAEPAADLVVLCKRCHGRRHGKVR